MFIYIVRHAWAFQHGDSRWPNDSDRPLEPGSAERFGQGVDALAPRGCEPNVIATSPYVRCGDAADFLAARVPGSPRVGELDALQPGSDLDALAGWSRQYLRGESIAWVGHAPDVGWLAATLLGEGDAA